MSKADLILKKSDGMTVASELHGVNFDIEKAKKYTRVYSRSTGMECFIMNSRGKCLYESGEGSHICKFCKSIQSIEHSQPGCVDVHLYGSYQAERFGGKYVYFCPIGLVHWASPITTDNGIQGALIGGPVLLMNPDEFLIEDLIRKSGIDIERLDGLYEHVKRTPVVQPETVDSLSELLFLVALDITNDKTAQNDDKRESHEIQARISESVQQIKRLADREKAIINYPFEKERELLEKIALGDKPASQKILNEILGYVFFSSGKDFEVIKARVLELVVLLSRAAVEGGADSAEVFGMNYKYLSDIQHFKTVEELTAWLSKIMARFTDCVFNFADVRHKNTIYKAVDYIKRNYMARLTLEEVAKHVYLNPSYFSKIFKREMKCTFVSYVNKIRIGVSKNLLLDASIPLTEILSFVGFEDQSYFTKVFKKATGMTPGKFRESRGTR